VVDSCSFDRAVLDRSQRKGSSTRRPQVGGEHLDAAPRSCECIAQSGPDGGAAIFRDDVPYFCAAKSMFVGAIQSRIPRFEPQVVML
jgi:hypothetical protein